DDGRQGSRQSCRLEDQRAGFPGRNRRAAANTALDPREDLNGQPELCGRGLARKWLAQASIQLSLRPPDKALMLLDENPKPGVVLLAKKMRHHEGSRHAIAEQTVGQ